MGGEEARIRGWCHAKHATVVLALTARPYAVTLWPLTTRLWLQSRTRPPFCTSAPTAPFVRQKHNTTNTNKNK